MDWKDIVMMKVIWPVGAGGGSGGSMFEISAVGSIPDYDKGYAISAISLSFTSRAYT